MVTRDSVHHVHVKGELPRAPNDGPLNAQEHRYSRPKTAVPLSAAGNANWKNAGSRAIQILKDSKSRKSEQRVNGQTAALPKTRTGLPESVLGSKNGVVNFGKSPNGARAPHNMNPGKLASTRSPASVSAVSGRSSANIPNLASISNIHRPVVPPGLLPATCTLSSPRSNRTVASQGGLQESIGSPVALRSNRQRERNEAGETIRPNAVGSSSSNSLQVKTKQSGNGNLRSGRQDVETPSPAKVGETIGPNAVGSSSLQVKTKQSGNGNLRSGGQDVETPSPAMVKLAATARAIMGSKAGGGGGGITAPSRRTTGSPRLALRSGPQRYREAAATGSGSGVGASSNPTPSGRHQVRASDPTTPTTSPKPSSTQSRLLPRRPATALGHKVAKGAKAGAVGGGGGGAQANLERVRQVAKGTLVPKGKAPSKAGALEQYLKHKEEEEEEEQRQRQRQQQQVEEPPLFMDGRMMDLESVPNLHEDDKIILDLPDPE